MTHWRGRPPVKRLAALTVAAVAILLLSACGNAGSGGAVLTHPVDRDPGAGGTGGAGVSGSGANGSAASGSGAAPVQVPGGAAVPGPPVATTQTPSRPAAVVSLGDSYISGEAGRWAGNSPTLDVSGWGGTDRACTDSACSLRRLDGVYVGNSELNGCHRSDVAEIRSAAIPGATPVNLACSGARTLNVVRAGSGGLGQNGEPAQDDQLAEVARTYDVKLVVLSIGGNDLGFGEVITDCFLSFVSLHGCHGREQADVDARMPTALAGVAATIDDIRAVLAAAGQQPGSYRLVLQSYPSPIPRAAENRYAAFGVGRAVTGGCPVTNADLDWARDRLVPQISNALEAVAADKQVQFLDLRDALQGREVCASASALVHGRPSAAQDEWVRSTLSLAQGSVQEIMHPNAFGQRALGRCLALMADETGPSYACHNSPGQDESGMILDPS